MSPSAFCGSRVLPPVIADDDIDHYNTTDSYDNRRGLVVHVGSLFMVDPLLIFTTYYHIFHLAVTAY